MLDYRSRSNSDCCNVTRGIRQYPWRLREVLSHVLQFEILRTGFGHLDVICNRLWSTACGQPQLSPADAMRRRTTFAIDGNRTASAYVRSHSGSLQSIRVSCSSSRSIWPEFYRTQTTVESKQIVVALLLNRDASKPPVLPLCSGEQALLALDHILLLSTADVIVLS